ncbi:hypothetical protein ACFFRR_006484 [Megaselia abdita]
MDLKEDLTRKLSSLESIKDCMTIFVKSDKEDFKDQFDEILKMTNYALKLQNRFQELKPAILHESGEKHDQLMSEWQKIQSLTFEMHGLVEQKKQEAKEKQQRTPLLKAKSNIEVTPNKKFLSVPGSNTNKTPVNALKQSSETPRMALSVYKESPMIRKIRPVSICFDDFSFKITQEMFLTIPKYMKGRETCDELNAFLENIIISIFNEKYQLLHRVRNFVKQPADFELWKLYNEQISYFPGQNFITNADVIRKMEVKSIDKRTQSKIVMLRHIAVLQEQRKQHLTCYIWIANPNISTEY